MQMDLINAQNQLESALEELKRRRILRDLMHDYISDALRIVKNLIIPDVTNSEKGKLIAIDNYKAAQSYLLRSERMIDEHGRVFYFGISAAEALIVASGNEL